MNIRMTKNEVHEAISSEARSDAEVAEWLGITVKAAQGHLYRLRDDGMAWRRPDGKWEAGVGSPHAQALADEARSLRAKIGGLQKQLERTEAALAVLVGT